MRSVWKARTRNVFAAIGITCHACGRATNYNCGGAVCSCSQRERRAATFVAHSPALIFLVPSPGALL